MDGLKIPAPTKKPGAVAKKIGIAEYKRIELALREQVGEGNWSIGAMLPSRRALARQYSVSLVTLDRAIGPLLADGTLRADDRRGTFVLRLPKKPAEHEAPEAQAIQRSPLRSRPEGMDRAESPIPVRTGSVGIIASLAREEGQEYLILHELEQVLSQRGFSTTVLNRMQKEVPTRSLADSAETILENNLVALVVLCLDLDMTLIASEMSRMKLGALPTVCILAGELTLPFPHVFYDNRSGGYQAAQHLAERGWRDLTVVAPFTATWVSERIAGVRDALAHVPAFTAQPSAPLQILTGEGDIWDIMSDPRAYGYRTAQAAMEAGWRPSGGIIGISDGVALGVMEAASERGLKAGLDFAILGFDDDPAARTMGLTSLRPPMQGMAREAARLLIEHITGNDGGLQVRLRAQMIPRASTGRRGPAEI